MDVDIYHYVFLGLPSGEEGSKLSEKEITRAYKAKALQLHPDKRPDDPNAPANFQKLQTSYEILKDEKARKLFDDLLRAKQQKIQRRSQQDSKRRRMMSDLEQREQAAYESSGAAKSEEEIITRQLKEEISRIHAMHANKMSFTATGVSPSKKESVGGERSNAGGGGLSAAEKEKMLNISWEKGGLNYTAQRLREIFEKFGEVKDVVIRSSKKKESALIVMGTKEAVVAATGTVCGDLSNPLTIQTTVQCLVRQENGLAKGDSIAMDITKKTECADHFASLAFDSHHSIPIPDSSKPKAKMINPFVSGPGFIARGVKFRNTTGPHSQAVTLLSASDKSVFFRCVFQGYQDTLCVRLYRQFYRECSNSGTVDFIFDNAAAVFQNCMIYCTGIAGQQVITITAQGRDNPNQATGIIIQNSQIMAAPDLKPVLGTFKIYLGRPCRKYYRPIFLENFMDSFVYPAGWLPWDEKTVLNAMYYGEYKNSGPGSSTTRRVKWSGYHVIIYTDDTPCHEQDRAMKFPRKDMKFPREDMVYNIHRRHTLQ